ncbi:MAG: 2-oxoacid:acceptor oxidoreductase family protein [Elusimicrobia bacterium]|nr:2-oxoacid:acceptor oxidoreductase family protein [Elusimicrobiota bacterium]
MKKIIEVRFHGRGGQGAKTASILLAKAALEGGKYIQAFPEYGPERTGAPMKAYTRVSDTQIRIHSGVTAPDVVVVVDPTLLDSVDVMEGLTDEGKVIINTEKAPGEIKEKIKPSKNQQVHTVDATKIALETLGRPVMNVPMLGALVKVTGLVDLEVLKNLMKNYFGGKLSSRAVEGNLSGIQRAFDEVK